MLQVNFDHGRYLNQEVTNGQPPCIWRLMGCKLADAMKGSDMEVYYSLLCEVVRIAQADMEQIKPPYTPLKPEPEAPPPEPEKVADFTHRGPGL